MKKKLDRIFDVLKGYISNENDKRVFNHIVSVTKFAEKRAKDNNLNKEITELATEAASVHDIGKFHNIVDMILNEKLLSVFHGLIGGYFIKNYDNSLTGLLKNRESVSKIIACHIPFFIKENEILECMNGPLPYWDIKHRKEYSLDGSSKKLIIPVLSENEKIAAQILIASDNCVVEDKYVGIEKRLEYIFERYGDRFNEAGKEIYVERVKSIIGKYPMRNEGATK